MAVGKCVQVCQCYDLSEFESRSAPLRRRPTARSSPNRLCFVPSLQACDGAACASSFAHRRRRVPFRVCAPMNIKVLLRLFLWFSIIDQVEHRFYLVRCRRFDEVAISSSTTLTAKSLLYWHVALRSAFILSPDSAQWNLRGGMPLVNGVPKTYWEIAYDVLTRPPLIITYETSARKREAEALERELVQLRWSLTQLICFLHCKWRM